MSKEKRKETNTNRAPHLTAERAPSEMMLENITLPPGVSALGMPNRRQSRTPHTSELDENTPLVPYPKRIMQMVEKGEYEELFVEPFAAVLYPEDRVHFPEVNALLAQVMGDDALMVTTLEDDPTFMEFVDIDEKYEPLFKLLSDTDEKYIFGGFVADDNKFYIHSIRSLHTGKVSRFSSSDTIYDAPLQLFVKLLSLQPHEKPDLFDWACKRMTLTTISEFRMLLSYAPELFPPEIFAWADSSLSAIESGGLSGETKKHTLSALSYMLNIGWTSKPVQVPEDDKVRSLLDEKLYGLPEVKQALLEITAYMDHTHRVPERGILLVGPAGVGKTAIASFFSKITSMVYAEIDFSAKTDINSIIGSSRIYSNAKPGCIVDTMFNERSKYMILLLNELDKASLVKNTESAVTDPTKPLLSILDHHGLSDDFIECAIPTDGVFCIATANDLSGISAPMLSRFRIIEIPPYSLDEKRSIFEDYTLPSAKKRAELPEDAFSLTKEAEDLLLKNYAILPGARDLEEYAERFVEMHLHEKRTLGQGRLVYTEEDVRKTFGCEKQNNPVILGCGEAIGLYQVDRAAKLFKIQVDVCPGTGQLQLINLGNTNQLEYCRAAYTAVKNCVDVNIENFDVTIFSDRLLPFASYDYIGIAVAAAMFSAVKEVPLSEHELFWGGCDLFGNLQMREQNPTAAIKSIAGRGYLVYAKSGIHGHIQKCSCYDGIVELKNLQQLFSLLSFRNNHRR